MSSEQSYEDMGEWCVELEKMVEARDATIAQQAAEIERLRERIRELEDNDAIGRRLTDGHLARIAELEAVVGEMVCELDKVRTHNNSTHAVKAALAAAEQGADHDAD